MSDLNMKDLEDFILMSQRVKSEDKIEFMDVVPGNQFKMNNSPCSNEDDLIQYKSEIDNLD